MPKLCNSIKTKDKCKNFAWEVLKGHGASSSISCPVTHEVWTDPFSITQPAWIFFFAGSNTFLLLSSSDGLLETYTKNHNNFRLVFFVYFCNSSSKKFNLKNMTEHKNVLAYVVFPNIVHLFIIKLWYIAFYFAHLNLCSLIKLMSEVLKMWAPYPTTLTTAKF